MTGTDWPVFAITVRVDRAMNRCECEGECRNWEKHGAGESLGGFDGSPCGAIHRDDPLTVVSKTGDTTSRDRDDYRAMCADCRNGFLAPSLDAEIAAKANAGQAPLPGMGIEL